MGELIPEPERQTLKNIYSLIQTRDVERPSPRLPMSAAAISAQLSPTLLRFLPASYDFLPTNQDPQPLLLIKKPAREALTTFCIIVFDFCQSPQNFDRHLISHPSMTGHMLYARLGARRPILNYGWFGGPPFEGSTDIHPRSDLLPGKGLVGWYDLRKPGGGPTTLSAQGPYAGQYVKVRRGTERSTSHTSIDRRHYSTGGWTRRL